ncbi:MAG TPA: CotS family spore coat protein, partial [Ruminiclostridium sp.]|nr:CotS family spore coat protein [Ruminiclostridium sp.]
SLTNYRDMFIADTDNGRKLVKVTSVKSERINFMAQVKEHLFNNGFIHTDRTIITNQGGYSIQINDQTVYMSDLIDGRECNLDDREETMGCARLLAKMHRASYGFICPENSCSRSELGRMPGSYRKRLDEIKKLKKNAQKGKMKFDNLVCKNIDYFYDIGENALGLLNIADYYELVEEAQKNRTVSHHDFNHHNIYIQSDQMFLINFEYCCYDLKVYDLVNLLRRKMRKCNWDINEAVIILNEYNRFESISESEMELMRIMLMFPQKFWRVINKYYNSRKSWSEQSYLLRIQEVIDEIQCHRIFLEKFSAL